MHRELLDILVAPAGGGPLTLEADGDVPDVISGVLVAYDGTRFPIRDGVPRMVPEQDSSVTMDEGATQRSFGAKWAQYREEEKDQLADFQYQWFDERFGFAGGVRAQGVPRRQAPHSRRRYGTWSLRRAMRATEQRPRRRHGSQRQRDRSAPASR